jgi:hypothetical protein
MDNDPDEDLDEGLWFEQWITPREDVDEEED